MDAPTIELLSWIAERPRTYAETMEAWHSHCPRLLVWEDALAEGLVAVARRQVELTPAGRVALSPGVTSEVPRARAESVPPGEGRQPGVVTISPSWQR